MMKPALLGAGMLALAAAGSAGWAGPVQAAEISDDVVRIGVLTDMSGTYSDLSGNGSVVAAQMAVEAFGGTVDGKPVEVISADHQNKADIASSTARKWIDTQNVDMIAGLVTSSVALAVQEIGREDNVITMVSGAATSRLTGENCSPVGFHWAYDTYALAHGTGKAVVENGGDTWFFLTADYAFGHSLESDVAQVVKENGGQVLGAVRHPFPNNDFASFLLEAQASGAKVIGLANAGADTTNAIKQAAEFGITRAGQTLAGLLVFITDVHSLGLQNAQGLMLTTGFYWDRTDETRKFAAEFEEQAGLKPTMVHAGVYSSVLQYLKAVEATGTDATEPVAKKLHEMPVNDVLAKDGTVYPNGRMAYDMYLAQVKKPSESEGAWDYYNIVRTIPAKDAYQDPAESGCELVAKSN